MKKEWRRTSLFVFLICAVFLSSEATTPILPLDEVKVGMKGIGKSVFLEDRIEEFDVEILGVFRNLRPKKNMILAKLKGAKLDNTGVVQGMSGSPVYVEGRLIGAVAYGFPFAKEAIAGITPVEEMLDITKKETQKSVLFPKIPVKKHLTLQELFELNREFFFSKSALYSDGQTFEPLNIPLVFGGFNSSVFERARSFFSRLGFSPVMAGLSGQEQEAFPVPNLSLKEGEPVAVQLISGDLSMAAVGTVSYVDGNHILAFGHPIYNLGNVDYAMTKAKVITVVPHLEASFKVASPEALIGTFTQDRTSGLAGEIGRIPKLIPITVNTMDTIGNKQEFKMKVVDDPILTPVLVNFSLANLLEEEGRSVGNLSLALKGTVYLENGMNVPLEDMYSGQLNASITNLSSLLSAVVYFLINNEFTDLKIHSIDLDIQASEDIKLAYLQKVWLDKYEAKPGERININFYTRTVRGDSQIHGVSIETPPLPPGSEFQLVIADATSMRQLEISQYKVETFVPRSLNQLIRILGNLRKNNRIYFKVIASKPGLFLKGEEMPNLPPSMKSMFTSPRAAASVPTEIKRSTMREYQYPVPQVFRGLAIIPIKIKE